MPKPLVEEVFGGEPPHGRIVATEMRNVRSRFEPGSFPLHHHDGNLRSGKQLRGSPIDERGDDSVAAPDVHYGELVQRVIFHVEAPMADVVDIVRDAADNLSVIRPRVIEDYCNVFCISHGRKKCGKGMKRGWTIG